MRPDTAPTDTASLPNRRGFLRYGGLLAVGSAATMAGTSWPTPARAIEPIQRFDQARFKFSLAAYSYRSLLTGKNPPLTLADFIDDCAKMGLEGTELTSYYFPPEPDRDYINSLRHRSFCQGLDISGTAIRNDFCYPPGEQREKELAHVRKWVDYAAQLGTSVIRIFSGSARGDQTHEQAHQLAVEGMQQSCDYAAQRGVFLALENHGGLTAEVDGLLALVRDVKSPWFGVNLDTGNFHGRDPYADLARLAPYAVNVQVKVVMKPMDQKARPVDFSRLKQILTDAAYRGYVVLEYEEKEDPREACPRYIDALRKAFA
jgi:sugar phosphate isomerase/epimerase